MVSALGPFLPGGRLGREGLWEHQTDSADIAFLGGQGALGSRNAPLPSCQTSGHSCICPGAGSVGAGLPLSPQELWPLTEMERGASGLPANSPRNLRMSLSSWSSWVPRCLFAGRHPPENSQLEQNVRNCYRSAKDVFEAGFGHFQPPLSFLPLTGPHIYFL